MLHGGGEHCWQVELLCQWVHRHLNKHIQMLDLEYFQCWCLGDVCCECCERCGLLWELSKMLMSVTKFVVYWWGIGSYFIIVPLPTNYLISSPQHYAGLCSTMPYLATGSSCAQLHSMTHPKHMLCLSCIWGDLPMNPESLYGNV
jgi:hypothetical protein